MRLASILIVLILSFPIVYELLNLSLTPYLNWYLATVVVAMPFLFYVLHNLIGASEVTFKWLRQPSNRLEGIELLVLFAPLATIRFILS